MTSHFQFRFQFHFPDFIYEQHVQRSFPTFYCLFFLISMFQYIRFISISNFKFQFQLPDYVFKFNFHCSILMRHIVQVCICVGLRAHSKVIHLWQVRNAINSHCRRMVWLVHSAACGFCNFALPPDDLTSSHCRPIGWPVHIADGIVDGWFGQFAFQFNGLTSSHSRPMVWPVYIAVGGFDKFAFLREGMTNSHCRRRAWPFRIFFGGIDKFALTPDNFTNAHCCQTVWQVRFVAEQKYRVRILPGGFAHRIFIRWFD